MNKFVFSGVAASVLGAAVMLSGIAPASSATLPGAALAAPGETMDMVEQVQRRGDRHARSGDRVRRYDRGRHYGRYDRGRHYDRSRHGPRYSHRRSGFPHYYGGYYYSWPWWYGPSIGFGITIPSVTLGLGSGYSSAHVQWCMNRYRTYDPATDTYIPRVGQRAYCSSPYR